MEAKIKTIGGYIIEEQHEDGKWIFHTGMFNSMEKARNDRDCVLKYWPDRKFRIVRATTTYEVMEEAK